MSPVFTYDVATLIELIESKPCLWDKYRTARAGCTQYCLSRFLDLRLRYKSTSKLRLLFLCTNIFLVQRSKSNRPPAAAIPVRVKNCTTGAGSDSGKKPVCVCVCASALMVIKSKVP